MGYNFITLAGQKRDRLHWVTARYLIILVSSYKHDKTIVFLNLILFVRALVYVTKVMIPTCTHQLDLSIQLFAIGSILKRLFS